VNVIPATKRKEKESYLFPFFPAVSTHKKIRKKKFRLALSVLKTGFPYLLGPINPRPSAVAAEPFSIFGQQESYLFICYYHQDLHWGLFHPSSRLRLRDSAARERQNPHTFLHIAV